MIRGQERQKFFSSQKGFTLIEFVIYATLTGAILALGVGVLVNLLLLKAKSHTMEEIAQSERFISWAVGNAIRRANSISSPTPGNTSATLSLTMPQVAINPTVLSLVDNTLMMTEGAQEPVAISTPGVEISGLLFRNVAYPGSLPGAIRSSMTISATNLSGRPELNRVRTLLFTTVIRR